MFRRCVTRGSAFDRLGAPRFRTRHAYFQEPAAAARGGAGAALVPQPQQQDAPQRQALRDVMTWIDEDIATDAVAVAAHAPTDVTAPAAAGTAVASPAEDEDDFVVDAAADEAIAGIAAAQLQRDMSGNLCAVPKDAMDLVSDEFAALRKREVRRRRKMLYDIAHPDPADYAYDGKPVPVPPLNFGTFAPQSYELGHKMLVEQPYQLVRQAKAHDYFFEINDLYCEMVFIGRANAGKSSLINALTMQPVAKTSSRPNSTREINFYQSATPEELSKFAHRSPNKLVKLPAGGMQFTLVDVPGFGLEGMSDKWRDNAISLMDSYLGARRSVNSVFLCIDADRGLTPVDLKYFEWVENVQGVFWVLVTQCDKVPHSRVCAVMRQVYEAITKHRRKYHKVYPFVLPVSAATGANVDMLRALIAETSGVIPATKLRKLLKKRSHEALQRMADDERRRLADNAAGGGAVPAIEGEEGLPDASAAVEPSPAMTVTVAVADDDDDVVMTAESAVPGGRGMRMHTGMARAKTRKGVQRSETITYGGTAADAAQPPPPEQLPVQRAAPAPTGVVSRFIGRVAEARDKPDAFHGKLHRMAAADGRSNAAARRRKSRLVVQLDDGRYVESVAGRTVVSPTVDMGADPANRRAAWRSKQALLRAQKVAPSAPWSQPLKKMSPAEQAGYERSNGGVLLNTPDGFDMHAGGVMSDNDRRAARNLTAQKRIEDDHTRRVSRAAQPDGLMKRYGGAAVGAPTSSVLGL
jgi:GTP-binding protein EngB required for normal cell division